MKKYWLICNVFFAVCITPVMGLPLTNSVPVTTNIIFELCPYRGTGAKLEFDGPTNQFFANEEIDYRFRGWDTNCWVFFRRFPEEQSFDFRLFDAAGREVAKTAKGQSFSITPQVPKDKVDLYNRLKPDMFPGGAATRTLFRPDQMFDMTNKGTYELEVRAHIFAQVPDGHFFEMPGFLERIEKEAKYENKNAYCDTNNSFGLVISPPVRVKVIKLNSTRQP